MLLHLTLLHLQGCRRPSHSGNCVQVSAGYDAHWRDPLAGLQMRSSTYHRLSQRLTSLSQELCGECPVLKGLAKTSVAGKARGAAA